MYKDIQTLSKSIYNAINEAFDFNNIHDNKNIMDDNYMSPEHLRQQLLNICNKEFNLFKRYEPYNDEISDKWQLHNLSKYKNYYGFNISPLLYTQILIGVDLRDTENTFYDSAKNRTYD